MSVLLAIRCIWYLIFIGYKVSLINIPFNMKMSGQFRGSQKHIKPFNLIWAVCLYSVPQPLACHCTNHHSSTWSSPAQAKSVIWFTVFKCSWNFLLFISTSLKLSYDGRFSSRNICWWFSLLSLCNINHVNVIQEQRLKDGKFWQFVNL